MRFYFTYTNETMVLFSEAIHNLIQYLPSKFNIHWLVGAILFIFIVVMHFNAGPIEAYPIISFLMTWLEAVYFGTP